MLVIIFLVLQEGPKVGLFLTNLVKIFIFLEEGPKVGLFLTNVVKTALIYSVVTIYLGLRPRIDSLIFLMFHAFLVFAIGHHAHMSPLIHIDTLEHCTSSKIFIEKGQTSSQRQDLTCQQNCVILRSWYTFGVRGQKVLQRIMKSLDIISVAVYALYGTI